MQNVSLVVKMVFPQDKSKLPCAIQCMIFNETAISIGELVTNEIGQPKPQTIAMDETDMSGLSVGKFLEKPVICREGWGLNDF